MSKVPKLPALPAELRMKVITPDAECVIKMPNTPENRAKSLGPVPFDMLHEATFTHTPVQKQ